MSQKQNLRLIICVYTAEDKVYSKVGNDDTQEGQHAIDVELCRTAVVS